MSSPTNGRRAATYTVLGSALLALSLCVYPASWLFSHYFVQSKVPCFSDVCDDNKGSNQQKTRNMLVAFYTFLLFTAAVALAAKLFAPVRRVLSVRVGGSSSTVTLGEIVWFFLAGFVALFVCSAANWKLIYPKEFNGQDEFTQSLMDFLMVLTGDSLGVLFGFVMLPASKYSAINDFLGLPYTATVRVHIWLAYLAFWTLLSHISFALINLSFDKDALSTIFALKGKKTPGWGHETYLYIVGDVAFFAFLFVLLTSFKFVRRRFYNAFYFSHFMVIVVLLFAYFHAAIMIHYSIPGIALWTIDGILRLASRVKGNAIVSLTQEPAGFRTMTIASTRGAVCRPGHFVRICVPAVSIAEYHPLSVVRATPDSITLMFAPDKESQWTARMTKHIETRLAAGGKPPIAQVQGPFGSVSRLASDPSMHSLVAYVAGTGAAPAFAILRAAVEQRLNAADNAEAAEFLTVGQRKDAAKTVGGTTVRAELRRAGPRLYLFWVASGAGLELASEVVDLARAVGASDAMLTVHVFDTSEPGSVRAAAVAGELAELPGVEVHSSRARPHLLALLGRYVSGPVSSAVDAGGRPAPVGIFVCGPDRFIEDSLVSVTRFQQENRGVPVELEVESYGL
ncbi:hypothetical protein HK405_007728 [Cladochytrium tenue]|nr:hypothetical protein HK405_007728 [Cladochytrium tenue]